MHLGEHHFHKRRISGQPKIWIDHVIYIVGVAGPLLSLPQVYKIWHYKTAAGVSAFSWGALAVSAVVWFIYGLVHKDKPIILTYAFWIIINTLVMVGALIYG